MTTTEPHHSQSVVLLRHRDDVFGENTARNAALALGKAHFRLSHREISEPLPDLADALTVLICTERLDLASPGTAGALARFVGDGGGVIVLHRGLHAAFSELFGIVEQDRSAAVSCDSDHAGLCFPSRIFPSFEGLRLDASAIRGHAAFDIVPVARARVAATTWTGKPLAWRLRRDRGYLLYWNTTVFGLSRMRGLIVESLASVAATCVVPMVNAGVVQVDDFPAPLRLPPADLVGPARPADFYRSTWWPDIHRLARKHRIPLTCFVTFDYSNITGADANPVPATERAIVETGTLAALRDLPPAEIGLHGWNHLPLSVDHWPDRAAMAASLDQACDSWGRLGLGPLPTSYVPPMNIYDRQGIAALTQRLPGLRSVSGVAAHVAADATPQEFGPEPSDQRLTCLPRVTWGYESNADLLFDCACAVAALGIWTHFLHPDDIADVRGATGVRGPARNPSGLSWRGAGGRPGLYDRLSAFLTQVTSRFPWLEFRTTTDAADRLRRYLAAEWTVDHGPGRVCVSCPAGSFFRLRTNAVPRLRIVDCEGGVIAHRDLAEDFCHYLIRATGPRVDIRLAAEEQPATWTRRLSAAMRRAPDAATRERTAP